MRPSLLSVLLLSVLPLPSTAISSSITGPYLTWLQPVPALAFPALDDVVSTPAPVVDGYGGSLAPSHWDVLPNIVSEFDAYGAPLVLTKLLPFRGGLLLVGVWATCAGPRPAACATVGRGPYPLSCACGGPSAPAVPNGTLRGASFWSGDGGQSWTMRGADPRLALIDFAAVTVTLTQPSDNGDNGVDVAACVVGGFAVDGLPTSGAAFCRLDPTEPALCTRSAAVTCTYDGAAWWDAAPLPEPIWRATVVAVNATPVVLGGLRASLSTAVYGATVELGAGSSGGSSSSSGWNATGWIPVQPGVGVRGGPAVDLHREHPAAFFSPNQSVFLREQDSAPFLPYAFASHLPRLLAGGGYPNPPSAIPPVPAADLYFLPLPEALPADGDGTTTLAALAASNWTLLTVQMPTASGRSLQLLAEAGGPFNDTTLANAGDRLGMRYALAVVQDVVDISPNKGVTFLPVKAIDMAATDAVGGGGRGGGGGGPTPYGTLAAALPLDVKPIGTITVGPNPTTSFVVTLVPEPLALGSVVFFAQRGPYLLAGYQQRCTLASGCAEGSSFPRACQRLPWDSVCAPCEACGNESLVARTCSFAAGADDWLASVENTVCVPRGSTGGGDSLLPRLTLAAGPTKAYPELLAGSAFAVVLIAILSQGKPNGPPGDGRDGGAGATESAELAAARAAMLLPVADPIGGPPAAADLIDVTLAVGTGTDPDMHTVAGTSSSATAAVGLVDPGSGGGGGGGVGGSLFERRGGGGATGVGLGGGGGSVGGGSGGALGRGAESASSSSSSSSSGARHSSTSVASRTRTRTDLAPFSSSSPSSVVAPAPQRSSSTPSMHRSQALDDTNVSVVVTDDNAGAALFGTGGDVSSSSTPSISALPSVSPSPTASLSVSGSRPRGDSVLDGESDSTPAEEGSGGGGGNSNSNTNTGSSVSARSRSGGGGGGGGLPPALPRDLSHLRRDAPPTPPVRPTTTAAATPPPAAAAAAARALLTAETGGLVVVALPAATTPGAGLHGAGRGLIAGLYSFAESTSPLFLGYGYCMWTATTIMLAVALPTGSSSSSSSSSVVLTAAKGLSFAGIALAGVACAMTLAALVARSVVRARDMAALSAALAEPPARLAALLFALAAALQPRLLTLPWTDAGVPLPRAVLREAAAVASRFALANEILQLALVGLVLTVLDGPPPLLLLGAAGLGLAGVGASAVVAAVGMGGRIAALAKGERRPWARIAGGQEEGGEEGGENDVRRPLTG
jgi:hypothetical protein